MLTENRIRADNALAHAGHAGVSSIGFEAFRQWCVSLLRGRMRFDGVIWATLDEPGLARDAARIQSAYLYRIPEAALADFERLRAPDLDGQGVASSRAANLSLGDEAWASQDHEALREHALRHGMSNSLMLRHSVPGTAGEQVILLSRRALAHRFSAADTLRLEWLAPHMAQAYATRRKLFVESTRAGHRSASGFAAAMVDQAGVVHDNQASFVPMLKREWSDWPGKQLPDSLMDLARKQAGSRWRFVGMQVTADFEPVGDLYLVAARPRHLADALTSRESEVAERYAAGDNFREIALALELAPATVRSHLRNVFGKLQVRNKTQLAAAMHR